WRRRTLTGPRVAALAAAAGIAAAGVVTLRGGDFDQFVHFLGVGKSQPTATQNVQTYVQHTLLAYIGLRIFLSHPILGVGVQRSSEAPRYEPHLAQAHRRFPHAAALSFPSPQHPWGVQNAYVQALADLGIVGFLLFVGLFASGLVVAGRQAVKAAVENAAP